MLKTQTKINNGKKSWNLPRQRLAYKTESRVHNTCTGTRKPEVLNTDNKRKILNPQTKINEEICQSRIKRIKQRIKQLAAHDNKRTKVKVTDLQELAKLKISITGRRKICNRPFSKMAAENSNKSKLKTFTSTRKNTITLVNLQSFSVSGVILAEKMYVEN